MRIARQGPSRRSLWIWFVTTLTTGGFVFIQSAPLETPQTPGGILDLELAGTLVRATHILDVWQSAGLTASATVNLWVDFAFLVSYSTFLALALLAAARSLRRHDWTRTASAVTVLALGQWLAGALDAVENISLLALVGGARSESLAALAAAAATVKFTLVGLGVLTLVMSGVLLFTQRPALDGSH